MCMEWRSSSTRVQNSQRSSTDWSSSNPGWSGSPFGGQTALMLSCSINRRSRVRWVVLDVSHKPEQIWQDRETKSMNLAVQPELLQIFLGRREVIADAWYTAI